MKTATLMVLDNKVSENNSIHGIANSLTKTRSGVTVTQEAGKNVLGKTVPLLMAHDWSSLPIGTAKMTNVDKDGLHYEGNIFDSVENKPQILEAVKSGVLSVSIGFGIGNMDEDGTIDDIDLLELSLTPVPADSKATVTQSLHIEGGKNSMTDENTKIILEAIKKLADTAPTTPPADDDKNAPTIQDVLDAVNNLTKEFEAQFPPKDSSDGSDDSGADTDKTEALEKANKQLMSLVDKLTLSFSDRLELREIKKTLK